MIHDMDMCVCIDPCSPPPLPPASPPLSSKAWSHRQLRDPFVRRSVVDDYRSRSAYKLDEIQHLFRPGQVVVDCGASPGGWSQLAAKWTNAAEPSSSSLSSSTGHHDEDASSSHSGGGWLLDVVDDRGRPTSIDKRTSCGAMCGVVISFFHLFLFPVLARRHCYLRRIVRYLHRSAPHLHITAEGMVLAVDMLPIEPLAGVTTLTPANFLAPRTIERIHRWLGGRAVDLLLSDMAPRMSGQREADHHHSMVRRERDGGRDGALLFFIPASLVPLPPPIPAGRVSLSLISPSLPPPILPHT